MINDQVAQGLVQYPSDDVMLIHSMGVVKKKLEPGQVGNPKVWLVVEAAQLNSNDCIRDIPFRRPSINDVVRSSNLIVGGQPRLICTISL
jgi:hypothetical protein